MLSSEVDDFTSTVGAELSGKDVHLDERFTAFAIGTAAAKMMPLRTSALRQNIKLVTVGEGKTLGQNWQRDRWNMFLEELKGYKNDTVVLHVDGYDVLFVQSADALWSEYQRQVEGKGESAILFGITTAGMYTPCRKGFELNNGVFMGRADYVMKMVVRLLEEIDRTGEPDDQETLNKMCSEPGLNLLLDTESRFVVGTEGGWIRLNGGRDGKWCLRDEPSACPAMVHGNGHAPLGAICDALGTKCSHHVDVSAKAMRQYCHMKKSTVLCQVGSFVPSFFDLISGLVNTFDIPTENFALGTSPRAVGVSLSQGRLPIPFQYTFQEVFQVYFARFPHQPAPVLPFPIAVDLLIAAMIGSVVGVVAIGSMVVKAVANKGLIKKS